MQFSWLRSPWWYGKFRVCFSSKKQAFLLVHNLPWHMYDNFRKNAAMHFLAAFLLLTLFIYFSEVKQERMLFCSRMHWPSSGKMPHCAVTYMTCQFLQISLLIWWNSFKVWGEMQPLWELQAFHVDQIGKVLQDKICSICVHFRYL